MHARRSLLVGACLLACDPRPTADGKANEAEPVAPPAPASVEDPPEPTPTPAEAPIPIPEESIESIAELEERAWTQYRAREYEAAGAAFTQLSEREPTIWKHPYNAACAAALRQDYVAAQLALVEAFRRGGDAARAKAKRDGDLAGLHGQSWWSELLAADEAQLAAWQLRDDQPKPEGGSDGQTDTPLMSRLIPYKPGEAPVDIRLVAAAIEGPPRPSASWRLRTSFEVDKRKPWIGGALLLTTCEADGRYFAANRHLSLEDIYVPVGRSHTIEVQTFADVFTNDAPELQRCELRFAHFPVANADGRLIAEYCYTGARVEAGPCRDFQRSPSGKLEAQMTSRFVVEGSRTLVFAYVNLGAGVGPRPSERYHVSYDCRIEDRRVTGARALLTPGRYDFLVPGEVMQGSIALAIDEVMDGCELVLERTCCDQGQHTGVGPYCVTAAGQAPGPCAWD